MTEIQIILDEIRKIMEIQGENPFKVRAFQKAVEALERGGDLRQRAQEGTLTEIPGVGKSIAEIISDFILKGETPVLDQLRRSLPQGLMELTVIPGLGPKKARQLIDELEIHSVSELEYACRENRLISLKGFGEKVQKKILEGIEFHRSQQGLMRWVDAQALAERFLEFVAQFFSKEGAPKIFSTGALRRRLEILDQLEFLVVGGSQKSIEEAVSKFQVQSPLPIRVYFSSVQRLGVDWVRTSGTSDHWKALGESLESPDSGRLGGFETEEKFYAQLGLPWIPPEMRETGEEVSLARSGDLAQILPWDGVRGIFHHHTVFSDGAATIEEMVLEAKQQGYEYIGISDHSQSAFYARGLKPENLIQQEREIRKVQERYPEIRIFWGIESDILADGSLDYDEKWLKKFDFVIASVHSRFQMDREAMTHRILKAIRNPYTRFLGHLTGRLLLGRRGYDLDFEKIMTESRAQNVAIEINANPARLDLDWRWGRLIRNSGTLVSIHPDAHDIQGIADTVHGVAVARKALLPKSLVLNTRSIEEVEKWLKRG